MKNRLSKIFILLFVVVSAEVSAGLTTFEIVVKGKSCKETINQTLSCEYKIGKDLYISVDGIGQPDAGVTFMKSDFDGDFYATFGLLHGCIVIKRGPKSIREDNPMMSFDYAFISPKNGKVYRKWKECQTGF